MKNLSIFVVVALVVLGVVYFVKHKQTAYIEKPAYNSGAPLSEQPPGPYDGTYVLKKAICLDGKSQNLEEKIQSKLRIRGMAIELDRKVSHCDITQTLTLVHGASSADHDLEIKQGRVSCAPDCPCIATVTGLQSAVYDGTEKSFTLLERTRAEKEICKGKLPVKYEYVKTLVVVPSPIASQGAK